MNSVGGSTVHHQETVEAGEPSQNIPHTVTYHHSSVKVCTVSLQIFILTIKSRISTNVEYRIVSVYNLHNFNGS